MKELQIRQLLAGDIEVIATAFARLGWDKPAAQYERYLAEQERGERDVLVVLEGGKFAGYLTIVWRSTYPPFRLPAVPG